METTQEKPRVKYGDFKAAMANKDRTIGVLIERYIRDMEKYGKPVGESGEFCMRRLQREKIATIDAFALSYDDVKEHARFRIKAGVHPSTVLKDLSALSVVLKYAGSDWKDCKGLDDKAVKAAKPSLLKHNVIGKSEPRSRRPTDEEHALLLEYFREQNEDRRCKLRMDIIADWQRKSARRISETCKLLWLDWNYEDRVIMVRGMKDPRTRHKNRLAAIPAEAQEILLGLVYEMNERPELRTDEKRIFPYRPQTCSARYTQAKKELQAKHPGMFENLHLHDSRRDCASRLAEKGHSSNEIRLVTQHETNAILDRVYNRPDPKTFKDIERPAEIQADLDRNRSKRIDNLTPRQSKEIDESWANA